MTVRGDELLHAELDRQLAEVRAACGGFHAADDCQSGHKGPFAEAATRLGFEGPMTQTPPGLDLTADVITLAEALGPFPHAKLDPTTADVPWPARPAPAPDPGGKVHSGPGKQGTRMIKLTAACCGYTVRTTRKWLDEGIHAR